MNDRVNDRWHRLFSSMHADTRMFVCLSLTKVGRDYDLEFLPTHSPEKRDDVRMMFHTQRWPLICV